MKIVSRIWLSSTFRNATIPRRVGIGYALLVIVMLMMGATVIAGLTWIRSWNDSYADTQQITETASTFSQKSASMVVFGAGKITSQDADSRDQYAVNCETNMAKARTALESLTHLVGDDLGEAPYLLVMQNQFTQMTQLLQAALQADVATPMVAAQLLSEGIVPAAHTFDQSLDAFLTRQRAHEDAALESLDRNAGIVVTVISVLTAVGILSGILLAWTTSRHITSRLRSVTSSVSTSATELTAVATQVAASAAQTAASTSETTATIEEVKQTAVLAQEKAMEASELSQEVVETSKRGQISATTNVANFEQIQSDMDVVIEAIERLDQQAQSVGDVIATVKDLAEQSNLLSVNASIEAAKAGEYGKGFTVVAQEVKSLAEQSKQGVAQVRAVLNEIQKASNMVVHAAEKSRATVETGRAEASHAVENNAARVAVGNKAAEATAQISASSRQALAGMEQIAQAINSINEAGNQSVAGTKQVEQEAKQLQELALTLRRLVEARVEAETT